MALRTAVLLAAGLVAASGCTGDSGNEDTIGVTGQLALVTDLEPVQQDLLTRASAVFLADAGGEDSRRLTEPRSALDEVGSVAWSPDGTRIAYTTGESPGADLFVANADGTDPRKLTSFPSPAAARLPVWSPDGGRIAFYEFDDGGTAIWVVRPDGSGRRQLTERGWHPIWLQGDRIAYVDIPGVVTMDADGGNQRQLADSEVMSAATQHSSGIAASPDGTRIAYVAPDGGLWVMNADGRGRRLLYGTPTFSTGSPVWSPDGRRIAFEQHETGPDSEIFVADADGGGRAVTENTAHDRDPAWSPEGRTLAFVSEQPEGIDVFLVAAEGGPTQNLTDSEDEDGSPAWRP